MTKKELIEALEPFGDDEEVYYRDWEGPYSDGYEPVDYVVRRDDYKGIVLE